MSESNLVIGTEFLRIVGFRVQVKASSGGTTSDLESLPSAWGVRRGFRTTPCLFLTGPSRRDALGAHLDC
jgi:hypothetical protein